MILTLARGETYLRNLEDVPEPDREERLKSALWVDVLQATHEEVALIQSTLKVELFDTEELHEIEESSRVFIEKDDLNLVAWLPVFDSAVPTNLPVGFIVDNERLISTRNGDFHAFRVYAEPRRRSALPRVLTPAVLLVEVLDTIVGQLASTLRSVEQDLNGLSLELFADHEPEGITNWGQKNFRRLKSVVHRLGRRNALVANLRESAVTLSTLIPFIMKNGKTWIGEEAIADLQILEQDLTSLRDYNAQLASEISFLLDSTLGLISLDENQAMKFLGVAALIVAFV